MKHDLEQLRTKCPLPVLMSQLGLGRYARPSCPSPFRADHKPSWGIFQSKGRWKFKDFATGEYGDEITFLAKVHKLDPKSDFIHLLDLYADAAQNTRCPVQPGFVPASRVAELPDTLFLREGSAEDIRRLSVLRGISISGLQQAQICGLLKFGKWNNLEVFAVMDRSAQLGEVRRLDGLDFPGFGRFSGHKSHTLKFSRKNWPLGILEAAGCAGVALVEGLPDFLAMHQFVVEEGQIGKIAPVAMLTSSCDIAAEALPYFTNKCVRIFPHSDQPGIDAAERWQKQLIAAGAKRVDFFNFRAIEAAAGTELKDLCDFNQQRGLAGTQQQQILGNILI
jgi:hypothetical protein